MKILAIRGCNLASIAGEFEIDLAHGPLGGAGVFAIVGNTGAGKSTLLDALCVALFDRTPRLTNHSTVKIGRGADERALLGAQDVRTLLRRGTAQGWAEVDFESGDARQYRARWSVRRARGQSDGTLQDEQLSLIAIAGGERFGGTKTETLKAIHARLGLSFDQFRRSALLAQGEFAAFLRADGKDRSELLERMTGTQIYSKLSVAAHVRAVLAEQRLRDGKAAALAITVLDDDAVRATEGELVAARGAADDARRRHAAAAEAARWIAEAERRARLWRDAGAEHERARANVTAAEADRAELALRRRAELLRPAWDEAARLERGVGAAACEVAAASDAAARAVVMVAQIGERRAAIAAAHAPVRAARIAAGLVERAWPAGAVAGALPGPAENLINPGDAAWLTARGALAPEIAGWPELDARFAQHAALGDQVGALDRVIADLAEQKVRLEREQQRVAGEVKQAATKHDAAKRKAVSFAQKRGLPLDAARRAEDEARRQLGEMDQLMALAAAARDAAQARAELERQLAELTAGVDIDRARRDQLAEAQRVAQAVRGEQVVVVDGLRRAAGYEHARAELIDGEPCPLCGAADHPWRDRGALDDVIAAAEARLVATLTELDAIASEGATIAARDDQRRREQVKLARQREANASQAATLAASWRDRLGALGELMLVGDPAEPGAAALAADRQALARKRLEEARNTRSQSEAATKAAQDAQGEVQLCQSALDQLTGQLADYDRRLADLDAALGRSRGERVSKSEHHEVIERELAAAMARWLAALPGENGAPALAAALAAVAAASGAGASGAGALVMGALAMGAPAGAMGAGKPRAAAKRVPAAAASGLGAAAAAASGLGAPALAAVGAAASGLGAAAARDASAARGIAAATELWGHATSSEPGERILGTDGKIRSQFTIALVERLQASAKPRSAPEAMPATPLAIVRLAMSAVATAWRDCAERIAHADATLAAAAIAIDREARDVEHAVTEHTARRDAAEQRRGELARELAAAVAQLVAARAGAGFDDGELRRLLSADPSRIDVLAERLAALDRAVERARAVMSERERQVADHAATRPGANGSSSGGAAADAAGAADAAHAAGASDAAHAAGAGSGGTAVGAGSAASNVAAAAANAAAAAAYADALARDAANVDGLAAAVTAADQRAAQLTTLLAMDAEARERRAAALADVEAEAASAEVDRILGDVIGSHDGKLFRSFAQSLTLDSLLAVANAHLEELAPRYQLERVPRHDLELQVVDRDLGSEVRSVQSLSGGESFLVSLALALGLSSMSAHDVRVRTLLIDEGFGTLDPATLDSALSVLDALQATGRQVGVISHVPALVERVGAHVRVVQRGGGRSEVVVA